MLVLPCCHCVALAETPVTLTLTVANAGNVKVSGITVTSAAGLACSVGDGASFGLAVGASDVCRYVLAVAAAGTCFCAFVAQSCLLPAVLQLDS